MQHRIKCANTRASRKINNLTALHKWRSEQQQRIQGKEHRQIKCFPYSNQKSAKTYADLLNKFVDSSQRPFSEITLGEFTNIILQLFKIATHPVLIYRLISIYFAVNITLATAVTTRNNIANSNKSHNNNQPTKNFIDSSSNAYQFMSNQNNTTIDNGHSQADTEIQFSTVNNQQTLHALIQSKAGFFRKDSPCASLPQELETLAIKIPSSAKRMRQVLLQPNFQFVCDDGVLAGVINTNADIKPILPDSVEAAYSIIEQKIYLKATKRHLNSLNHELSVHAYYHSLHTSEGKCPQNDLYSSTLPFYPANKKNYKKFSAAISAGNKRIKSYDVILNKILQNKSFSKAELEQCKKLEDITKNCLPYIKQPKIKKSEFAEHPARYWTPQRNIKINLGTIINVRHHANEVEYHLEMSKLVSVLTLPDQVDYILKNNYINANKALIESERIAHTLEYLSDEARDFFYPELTAFLAAQDNQCLSVVAQLRSV